MTKEKMPLVTREDLNNIYLQTNIYLNQARSNEFRKSKGREIIPVMDLEDHFQTYEKFDIIFELYRGLPQFEVKMIHSDSGIRVFDSYLRVDGINILFCEYDLYDFKGFPDLNSFIEFVNSKIKFIYGRLISNFS